MPRDVEGVGGLVFISLAGVFEGTSLFNALSMAPVWYIIRSIGHETHRDKRGHVIDLCAERPCRVRF